VNTKSLLPNARRLADALYGIKLALMILSLIAGSMYALVSLFATTDFGESAVDWAGVLVGAALMLTAVWVYALFGFGEYVIRLLSALVLRADAADFEDHVATAPLDIPTRAEVSGSIQLP
jgi:hypothetical protein